MAENKVRLLGEAIADAARFHGKQVRKDGTPYIYHPLKVAELLKDNGYPIQYQIAGALHDVLEDTSAKPVDLEKYGPEVVEAVKLLSRNYSVAGETDYINKILQNQMASAVKNMDRICNLLDAVSLGDKAFLEKYLNNTLVYFHGKFSPQLDMLIDQIENHKPINLPQAPIHTYGEYFEDKVKTIVEEVNERLAQYGCSVEYVPDYEFEDDDVGKYLISEQDDARVFPVAISMKALQERLDFDEWDDEILLTLYHEAAHGMMEYLKCEGYEFDDEERLAEDFAYCQKDGYGFESEVDAAWKEWEESLDRE